MIWLAETVHKHSARMMQVTTLNKVPSDMTGRNNLADPGIIVRLITVSSSLVCGSRIGESRLAR